MSRNTGPDQGTKDLLWQRAGGACEGCGVNLEGSYEFSRQHRIARGMGGTKDPRINRLSNLLLLCGSATSNGCHRIAETRDPLLEADGWWLRRSQNPLTVPVRLHGARWVLLGDDGTYQPLEDAA